ncbi:speckle-type POZ protein B [Trichonephila clavipes]|nr:speckle-type POZ protein B [Trichonephila clavipes]
MACNLNAKSNSCITFFWNIVGCFRNKFKTIRSPIIEVELSTGNSRWSFTLESRGENNGGTSFSIIIYADKFENNEVEWDLAFLADNDLVLEVKPKASLPLLKLFCGVESENAYLVSYRIGNEHNGSNCDLERYDKGDDLKEGMEQLYNEGTLTDVKLCTSTGTFHTHKAILSARSPVFRAMFTTDMLENIQERVDLPDVEADTVRRMLLYVYSNKLEGLRWDSSLKLYSAADKYEILTLKRKCSSFLKQNLSPSNVCDVLILADMHYDGDLKKAAQDYVFENEVNVFSSHEWADCMKNNVTLAAETMFLKWKKKT